MNGFCVDIGAPRFVVGIKELKRIFTGNKLSLPKLERLPSHARFRFADTSFESKGLITLRLATPASIPPILVTMDVVQADIPALLGMDILDRESLIADTVANRLAKREKITLADGSAKYVDGWSIPLHRAKSGHVFADILLPSRIHFTRAQLYKLHRQFFHPAAAKLFHLIKKARPEEATPEALEILKDLTKRCDPCQRIHNAPTRFRVSFGAENVRFNERVLIDIMYIDGKPILHVVDEATHFSAASFLPDVSTKTIWKKILLCWITIYTGVPNRMLVDQGSAFGKLFIDIVAMSNIQVDRTGVEAHSSLGVGERYHQPLRQTYRKIMAQNAQTEPELALAAAVKSMNDTLGPEGLVPSALVSGEYPPVHTRSETPDPRATLASRAKIASTARKEMQRCMAKLRLERALRHRVPRAANQMYKVGEKVLVWREKIVDNRIGEWMGPFTIDAIDEARKLVYVQDVPIGAAKPFNLAQVKHHHQPETLANTFFNDLHQSFSTFRSPEEDYCYLTEILDKNDPRVRSKEMTDAKKAEIRGLMERGTFKIMLREEIPPDANILPGRFVFAIKSTEDGQIKYRARYVIGGHRDKLKNMMVHHSATLQPQSIRLLIALAALHGFKIWTLDIRQAYLQSAEPLSREVFITKPVPEFELDPSQCLQLLKPLYGLCESGDLWYQTFDHHHKDDLGMTPLRSDPALYVIMKHDLLQGMSGCYVDDWIRSGNEYFKSICDRSKKTFQMTDEQSLPCTFTVFTLSYGPNNTVQMEHHGYLRKLEELQPSANFSTFRSMRMKLAWLANSRPDCLFEISQMAQVTDTIFTKSSSAVISQLNRSIRYAKSNPVSILFLPLDLETLRIIGYSDSSFANNADLSSQLGHICLLGDESGAVIPISFKSYKARRVTRSAMAGEVIAFSDMFDIAATLAAELKSVLGRDIPVQLLTDSKSLFDIISKGSRTSEKRMMLDIAAAREGFKSHVISDIGFVRSSQNIADGLTKRMQQESLRNLLSTGHLFISPEQWIIRG